jgi:hypothetical protein
MPDRRSGAAVLVVRAWREKAPELTFHARVTQIFDVPADESLEQALGAESVVVCSSPGQLRNVLDQWIQRLLLDD